MELNIHAVTHENTTIGSQIGSSEIKKKSSWQHKDHNNIFHPARKKNTHQYHQTKNTQIRITYVTFFPLVGNPILAG